jgi:hypothetical protein
MGDILYVSSIGDKTTNDETVINPNTHGVFMYGDRINGAQTPTGELSPGDVVSSTDVGTKLKTSGATVFLYGSPFGHSGTIMEDGPPHKIDPTKLPVYPNNGVWVGIP